MNTFLCSEVPGYLNGGIKPDFKLQMCWFIITNCIYSDYDFKTFMLSAIPDVVLYSRMHTSDTVVRLIPNGIFQYADSYKDMLHACTALLILLL